MPVEYLLVLVYNCFMATNHLLYLYLPFGHPCSKVKNSGPGDEAFVRVTQLILEDIPQLFITIAFVANYDPNFFAIASLVVTAYCIITKGCTALFYAGKAGGSQVTPYGAPHNEEQSEC